MLSANLADMVARAGHPTVLWDGDTDFPNQHILFGVEPPIRVNDVYNGTVALSAALHPLGEGLQLLAGKTAAGSDLVSPAAILPVFEALCELPAEMVFIDNAAGSSDSTLQFCALADLTMVVATDEPTSIVDAYGLIKILKTHVPDRAVGLLVNNIIDGDDADEVTKKLNLATKKFLNLQVPFLGFVPYDRAVRQSIVEQKPLHRQRPQSEAAQAIGAIARTMTRLSQRSSRTE